MCVVFIDNSLNAVYARGTVTFLLGGDISVAVEFEEVTGCSPPVRNCDSTSVTSIRYEDNCVL